MRCLSPATLRYLEICAFVLVSSIIVICVLYHLFYTPPPPPRPPPEVTVIVVTPTHKRFERLVDISRLANTLKPVRGLHWIVVENGRRTEPPVERILQESGITFVYLCATNPKGNQTRGGTQRNAALQYIRETYRSEKAVVYFADDDNLYDVRLFENYIRNVKKIGIWAVGSSNNTYFEVPRAPNGQVTVWNVMNSANRTFSNYIAGFAVNILELRREEFVYFDEQCALDFLEDIESCFLSRLALPWVELEQFGYDKNPREILVWNTRTWEMEEDGNSTVVS